MLIKTTGWRAAAVAVLALAALGFFAPGAAAAGSFLSLDCPLLAGSGVTASYYEDGVAKCAQVALKVTAPDGSVTELQPASCKNGLHVFPRFEARQRGGYAIRAVAPKAAGGCTAAGVAVQRRRVPEFNPLLAIAVAAGALLLARRNGL